jgi:hypothetical protein
MIIYIYYCIDVSSYIMNQESKVASTSSEWPLLAGSSCSCRRSLAKVGYLQVVANDIVWHHWLYVMFAYSCCNMKVNHSGHQEWMLQLPVLWYTVLWYTSTFSMDPMLKPSKARFFWHAAHERSEHVVLPPTTFGPKKSKNAPAKWYLVILQVSTCRQHCHLLQ